MRPAGEIIASGVSLQHKIGEVLLELHSPLWVESDGRDGRIVGVFQILRMDCWRDAEEIVVRPAMEGFGKVVGGTAERSFLPQ